MTDLTQFNLLCSTSNLIQLDMGMWQPKRGSRIHIKRGAEDHQLIKTTLKSAPYRRLQALYQRIRRWHKDNTWPWKNQLVLIPNALYEAYLGVFLDLNQQYLDAALDLAKYIEKHSGEAKTDSYPPPEYIIEHNRIQLFQWPLSSVLNVMPQAETLSNQQDLYDLNKAMLLIQLKLFKERTKTRLHAILKWLESQSEPENNGYTPKRSEVIRFKYMTNCEIILAMKSPDSVFLDIVQQTLEYLRNLPTAVSLDNKQHMIFFQRIKDLQTLLQ